MPKGVYVRQPTAFDVRFWRKVAILGPDECWPWQGKARDGKYGLFGGHPHSRLVHRIAYMLTHHVVLPHDVVVHHTCHERKDHIPLCCNPAHLELMNDEEHRRMHAQKRWADDKAGKRPFRKRTGMQP